MLVEIAIGDAMGAGFEFAKPERLAQLKNDLSTYYPHNLPGHLPAGSYTDDTQMSIGITEYLLETNHFGPDTLPLELANKWVEVYKRDPRNGYSRRFQVILDQVQSGQELLDKLVNKSDKCGAAMRSCPIGYLPKVYGVLTFSRMQAQVTHDTPDAIASSQAIALATHHFLYNDGKKKDLIDFLVLGSGSSRIFNNEKDLWPVGQRCTSDAIPCVKAAISAVMRNDSLSECLKECIDYTGDVDSIAAMAMGIGSCCKEIENDLPQHLYEGLENGPYGLDYLRSLDEKLERLREEYAGRI